MAGNCPPGCRPGSALFSRITLIILGAVGVWLFVVGILNLIVINQDVPAANKDNLAQATFVIDIIQVIVGFLVLMFVAYAVIAPQGTLKEYIQPYLEGQGDTGLVKLKRTTTTTVSE